MSDPTSLDFFRAYELVTAEVWCPFPVTSSFHPRPPWGGVPVFIKYSNTFCGIVS